MSYVFISKRDLYARFENICEMKTRCLNNLILLRQRVFNSFNTVDLYIGNMYYIYDIDPIDLSLILRNKSDKQFKIQNKEELLAFEKKLNIQMSINTLIDLWEVYKNEFNEIKKVINLIEEKVKIEQEYFDKHYKGKDLEFYIFFNPMSSLNKSLKKEYIKREKITIKCKIIGLNFATTLDQYLDPFKNVNIEKDFPSIVVKITEYKELFINTFIPLTNLKHKMPFYVLDKNIIEDIKKSLVKVKNFNRNQIDKNKNTIILPLMIYFPNQFIHQGYTWDWEINI